MDKIDADTIKVLGLAAIPVGLTLTQISAIVTITAGLVSIAYTIWKWVKNRKD